MSHVSRCVDWLFVPNSLLERRDLADTGWTRTAARAFGLAGAAAAVVVPVVWTLASILLNGWSAPKAVWFWVALWLLSTAAAFGAAALAGGVFWHLLVERLGSSEAPTTGAIAGGLTGGLAPVVGVWLVVVVYELVVLVLAEDLAVIEFILNYLGWGAYIGAGYLLYGGWLTIPLGTFVGKRLGEWKADSTSS